MNDPTYDIEEIKRKPIWYMAWLLSELYNDYAPLGWGGYIRDAEMIDKHLSVKLKK